MLIAYPDANRIGGGIGLKVKRKKGDQRAIGIDTEKRIILRSISVNQGEAEGGIGVRIGGNELSNHRVWGLVFEDGGTIKFEGVGGGIGHGVWVSWIGAVGNLRQIRESIPVIIRIEIVFDPVPVEVFHLIKQGNKKNSFQFRSMLIAYPDANGIGRGIGLEVKSEKGDQRTIGINGKKGIVIGSVPIDQGEAKGGIGIGIGGSELTDHGMRGLVFEDGGTIKLKCIGGGIGDRIRVARIGAVGNLRRVWKSIPIIIRIEIVLDPIPVQIFHLINQGNKKDSFQFRSVLITYPYPDGVGGGIGLEVKRLEGAKDLILMNLEEGIVIGPVPVGEGKAKIGTGIGIGGSELSNHRDWGLVFKDGGTIKLEGVGGGIGHRIRVARIGAVGNLNQVRKSIPIIIGVGVVFGAVSVQVFE